MIYGNLYIMSDVRNALLAAEADGCKIAVISEEPILDTNSSFAVSGTCLLPPPMAKIAEIDGDAERFFELYDEYLLSDVPVDFISVILGLLHQGGSMIFLISCGIDEPWVAQLCNHFQNYYGITIGSDGVLPWFDTRYTDVVNNIIYISGFISPQEYLANKTIRYQMQPWILDKLSAELPLRGTEGGFEYYEDLCLKFKQFPNSNLAVRFRRKL
jgi:hypothetical protein